MINIERQKENFKNHVAKFIDYGNIKILDFKDPDTSHYRIRFLFEEDYYRLHISGDLGELIATNFNNMTFEKFSDFVNNIGYFGEKIDCHSRRIYVYDEDKAIEELKEELEESGQLEYVLNYDRCVFETDEDKLNEFFEDVFEDFSQDTGIGSKGYDVISEYIDDAFEFVQYLGREYTGILDLYMLAFQLAMNQINSTIGEE